MLVFVIVFRIFKLSAFFVGITSILLHLCCSIALAKNLSDLRTVGFFPFVAELPVWTFDLPENYGEPSDPGIKRTAQPPTSHRDSSSILSFADLCRLSNTNSGVEAVALNEYLRFRDVSFTCIDQDRTRFTTESEAKDLASPTAAAMRCDASNACTSFLLTEATAVGKSSTVTFCRDDSWNKPKTHQGQLTAVKRSYVQVIQELPGYTIYYNHRVSCPSGSILTTTHLHPTNTSSNSNIYQECANNRRCLSFTISPVVVPSEILRWSFTSCSVIPIKEPCDGSICAIKGRADNNVPVLPSAGMMTG